MGDKSGIEWLLDLVTGKEGASWNFLKGCSRVDKGCIHCYAEALAGTRLHQINQPYHGLAELTSSGPRWTGVVRFDEEMIYKPLDWNRPRRIFVASMSDLFHDYAFQNSEILDRAFAVMSLARQHTYISFTKREINARLYLNDSTTPSNIRDEIRRLGYSDKNFQWPLSNFQHGVSVNDQDTVDQRLSQLKETVAAIRNVSIEPCTAPVTIHTYLAFDSSSNWGNKSIHGIVFGGESNHLAPREARPMHPNWARQIRDEVINLTPRRPALFFKQWGEWLPLPTADAASLYPKAPIFEWEDGTRSVCIGKGKAGNFLDGKQHIEYAG